MSDHNWDEDLTDHKSDQKLRQRIGRRFAYLLQSFEAYSNKLAQIRLSTAEMNKAVLGTCVERYFDDITWVKKTHGLERADRYKIAGYTLKWLSKLRPIQVGGKVPADQNAQRWMLLVNADFALIQAIAISRIDRRKMDNRFARDLTYAAQYRDVDGAAAALQFLALARLYPREQKNTAAAA
jgi:hypothetical protein